MMKFAWIALLAVIQIRVNVKLSVFIIVYVDEIFGPKNRIYTHIYNVYIYLYIIFRYILYDITYAATPFSRMLGRA